MLGIIAKIKTVLAIGAISLLAVQPVQESKIDYGNMKIIAKHGKFVEVNRWRRPYMVILHHTAGGTLKGAEDTLIKRGLGYHYMIDRDGVVYEYVKPHKKTFHAYKFATGTIGVSFVGGGVHGEVTKAQKESAVQLLKIIKNDYPSVKYVTGHKHADPRGWKIDPRWPGEPADGINWEIDKIEMKSIEFRTGLKFRPRSTWFESGMMQLSLLYSTVFGGHQDACDEP